MKQVEVEENFWEFFSLKGITVFKIDFYYSPCWKDLIGFDRKNIQYF